MMSSRAISQVLKYSRASKADKFIFTVIAHHFNDAVGQAWPSISTLAEETGYDQRRVKRSLANLRRLGELRSDENNGGRNRSNRYYITLPVDASNGGIEDIVKDFLNGGTRETLSHPNGGTGDTRIEHLIESKERDTTESDKLIPDSLSPSKKRKLTRPDPATADPRVKPFLSWFANEYERRYGAPYAINWGKDGKRINELAPVFDLPRLKDLAIRFFESPDPWVRQNGGFTIGVFISQINKLTSTDNGHAKPSEVKDLGDGWLEVEGMRISKKDYERRWKTA